MSNPMGLLAVHRALRAGTLSRADYLTACTNRADEVEPWLKAFVCRASADERDGAGDGPLAGIPVGVKDIIATAGITTTNGSPIYADHVPDQDAPIVARIKRLGGIVFGKTVSTEFAWRCPGPTVNPWNRTHTPGGSSSGSAAAVAAGIVPLALGTQTVGSIVRPAAYCGVVGFKPSFGAISRDGVHPLAQSLDHVGCFTRSVEDAAFAFSLLADASDAAAPEADFSDDAAAASSLRLGVVRPPIWDRVSSEQNAAFEAALDTLRRAGMKIEVLDLPDAYWQAFEAAEIILAAEAAAIFNPLIARYPDLTSLQLKELAVTGSAIAAPRYIAARQLQSELQAAFPRHLSGLDGILTVPAPGEAPEGLAYTGDASFCAVWTMLGLPALSMPIARSARGLPLGMQLIGGFGRDTEMLRTGCAVEACLATPIEVV